ncbi:MAG TPA: DUF447 domain-containing protein [Methanobacteriaceae archaeon]|nr:DUF447 domain-containing protein [Methanobacteriaceae archaeon]
MLDTRSLGMKEGQLYETIISTRNEDGTPNAAPMGIIIKMPCEVVLYLYQGSLTAKNIMRDGIFTVNILNNPLIFTQCTLSCPPQDSFDQNHEIYYLKSTDAYFTAEVTKKRKIVRKDDLGESELTIMQAKVTDVIKLTECVYPLNRAIYGIIELLVNLTRMDMATSEAKKIYLDRLEEVSWIVNRVGGKEDKEALKEIRDKFDQYR